jgi:uncharacterized membrane protein YfcA
MVFQKCVFVTCFCIAALAYTVAAECADCKDNHGANCSDCDEHDGHHSHFKHLLPLDEYDWAGFVSMGTFTAIAAGGGIGGGGVLVPLLILVMGFAIKSAIPLSNITVLGGAIFHILRNVWRRHPNADRPLIDWNFISLMQPMLIAGAVIGSFINKVVADWLLAASLFVILILTARRTWSNGMKQWNKENATAVDGMNASLMDEGGVPLVEQGEPEVAPELQVILKEDSQMPCCKIMVILVIFLGVMTLNIAKGQPGAESGSGFNPLHIECGSYEFWVISLAVIPWCLFGFFITRYMIVAQYYAKLDAGFVFIEGDIEWDEGRASTLPLVCLGAGVMAGMFGIGGGLINGPLMVELGVLPDVASATSATMILFTSVTATVCYVLFDILNFEYAQVLFPLGFCCTFIGQVIFNKVMEIVGRKSLVVFVIAFIVGASAVLMALEGGFTFSEYLHDPDGELFHPICAVPTIQKEITLGGKSSTHN